MKNSTDSLKKISEDVYGCFLKSVEISVYHHTESKDMVDGKKADLICVIGAIRARLDRQIEDLKNH